MIRISRSLPTRQRRVDRIAVLQVGREPLRQIRHRLLDAVGDVERVRAGHLKDADRASGLAVDAARLLVVERAELDARDILQPHHRAVRVRAHRDGSEFLRRLQPPLRADRVGHLLPGRRRLRADLTGRIDGALLLHGAHQIGNREPERGQPVRLHPDAHRVVAGAEDADVADAPDAIQRVDDVDVGVVGEEQRVVGLVRRRQRNDQHRKAGRLPHRQAEGVHVGRQVRLRLRHAVLDVHLIDVRIGLDVERDGQLHRAVVGVRRLHVEHVVDAVHLLLERRRDRLLDRQRVGPDVGRRHDDLRRDDVGKLRDRQRSHRDQAGEDGDDGDDDGDDRTADEEARHGSGSPPQWPARPLPRLRVHHGAVRRRSAFDHHAVTRLQPPSRRSSGCRRGRRPSPFASRSGCRLRRPAPDTRPAAR